VPDFAMTPRIVAAGLGVLEAVLVSSREAKESHEEISELLFKCILFNCCSSSEVTLQTSTDAVVWKSWGKTSARGKKLRATNMQRESS
jgi:hypothetical protein